MHAITDNAEGLSSRFPFAHSAVFSIYHLKRPFVPAILTYVLIKAFAASAASQGDCNVVSFGIDGNIDAETGELIPYTGFGFCETTCGGSGAGPGWHGTSGVHVHMTNTKICDPEIIGKRYPVILRKFSIRDGSGGKGQWNGGEGGRWCRVVGRKD
ncbi:5-oxoprolinase (ATP-hydrolyzing) [Fusarium sp. NRRL 52700]|nr:5-oxoprolinase (ATP-hydrolyzing) [Fusarium sp. NRRL 52700]